MLSKHKQKASINATNRIHLHDSKIYQAKTLKVKVYGDCFDRVSAGRNPWKRHANSDFANAKEKQFSVSTS